MKEFKQPQSDKIAQFKVGCSPCCRSWGDADDKVLLCYLGTDWTCWVRGRARVFMTGSLATCFMDPCPSWLVNAAQMYSSGGEFFFVWGNCSFTSLWSLGSSSPEETTIEPHYTAQFVSSISLPFLQENSRESGCAIAPKWSRLSGPFPIRIQTQVTIMSSGVGRKGIGHPSLPFLTSLDFQCNQPWYPSSVWHIEVFWHIWSILHYKDNAIQW